MLQLYSPCSRKKTIQLLCWPHPLFFWVSVPTHTMHIGNQLHSQPVASPGKSIAQGISLMNDRRVACQQETWIGLESLHTMLAFLKRVRLWERNKDARTRGRHWKQILTAGELSSSGLESGVKKCWVVENHQMCWWTRIKAPSIFEISKLRVKYLSGWKGKSDAENPRLGKGAPWWPLAAGLGLPFPVSYFASSFFGTRDCFLMLCKTHLIEHECPNSWCWVMFRCRILTVCRVFLINW